MLLDVPCSNDRLSVNRDEDNIFASSKTRERESLPEYQALLLYSAYNLCKPGGFVVYSTCSLSPSQVKSPSLHCCSPLLFSSLPSIIFTSLFSSALHFTQLGSPALLMLVSFLFSFRMTELFVGSSSSTKSFILETLSRLFPTWIR